MRGEPVRSCWKEPPSIIDKINDGREAKRLKRDVYKAVDERDKRMCRCCGKSADPRAMDALTRGHRHHIQFRSRGGQDTTENLVLLCAIHHAEVHARRLFIHGSDANGALRFESVKR